MSQSELNDKYQGGRLLLFKSASSGHPNPEFGESISTVELKTSPTYIGKLFEPASNDGEEAPEDDEDMALEDDDVHAPDQHSASTSEVAVTQQSHAHFLGQKPDTIALKGSGINTEHGEIYRRQRDKAWCIRDTSQGYGIYVNGLRIPDGDGCRLNHGDIIHIGSAVMRFQLGRIAIKELGDNEHIVRTPPKLPEEHRPPPKRHIRTTLITICALLASFTGGFLLWKSQDEEEQTRRLCLALDTALKQNDVRAASAHIDGFGQELATARRTCPETLAAYALYREDMVHLEKAQQAVAAKEWSQARQMLSRIPNASPLISQKAQLLNAIPQTERVK